jgi:hypothetical protein
MLLITVDYLGDSFWINVLPAVFFVDGFAGLASVDRVSSPHRGKAIGCEVRRREFAHGSEVLNQPQMAKRMF